VKQGAVAYRAHLYNGSYRSVVGLAERVTHRRPHNPDD
jgi:hypothetical protein